MIRIVSRICCGQDIDVSANGQTVTVQVSLAWRMFIGKNKHTQSAQIADVCTGLDCGGANDLVLSVAAFQTLDSDLDDGKRSIPCQI